MPDNIQDKLKLMQQNFRNKLRGIAAEVQTWESAEKLDDLLFICHKYAGSAGTFGLIETSHKLKAFELKLKQLPRPLSDEEAVALYREASSLLRTEIND